MISYDQALQQLAERTVENREYWKRNLAQRRSTQESIYGVRFYNELIDTTKTFEFHYSIMPSLEYYTRFAFNLQVTTLNEGASIDPEEFRFWIGNPSSNEDEEEMVEITPYLLEQGNEWVDGSGYFPSIDWEDGNEARASYDILDVCSLLTADDEDDKVDAILDPGVKLVRIKSPVPCDVTWIPDISYTVVNR